MKSNLGKSLLFASGMTCFISSQPLLGLGGTYDDDRDAILSHVGCYEVEFRYQETFPYQPDYRLAAPYQTKATEWVEVIYEKPGEISLQHILQTPGMSIKHWRQVWKYEPDSRFQYLGNGTWTKEEFEASKTVGAWVQKVYQVDDSPRYECLAPWIHWQENHVWECQAPSPLPRRESARKKDYDILQRRNRIRILPQAWVHEQDNLKLQFMNEELRPLVEERGINSYRRLPDEQCTEAKTWWSQYRNAWTQVQEAWDMIYSELSVIKISEDQSRALTRKLYQLVETSNNSPDPNLVLRAYQTIKSVIQENQIQ